MRKIKSMLYRFMYGRYGTDKLGNCMLIAYTVIILVQAVLSVFTDSVLQIGRAHV